MLPDLNSNQNVFIEITNLQHGGRGWELGTCLWSPVKDKGGSRAWRLMNTINQGDLIIHLVYIKKTYHFYGISLTTSSLIETENQPDDATHWSKMNPYQRINLSSFNRLEKPKKIAHFFNLFDSELRQIRRNSNHGQFYNEYGNNKELRMAQRYIAKCPVDLYKLFDNYSSIIDFNPILRVSDNIPTTNEPQNPDYNQPGRVTTIVSRIIRDTKLSREIKKENDWKCQVCGKSILLPNYQYYSEGHHLKPLGGEHFGPDIRENIIILCPTHHAEFDYGSIAVNPVTRILEHIDPNNEFHNKKIAYERKDLENEYLIYHYKTQFRKK